MAASSESNTRAGPVCDWRSWPVIFRTPPPGAKFPFKITRPPVAFSGLLSGAITVCPRKCLSRHGHRRTVHVLAVEQPLGDHRNAARRVHIRGHVFSRRLQIRQQRRSFADPLKIVNLERKSHFARNRQQMEHGVGRAARRSYARYSILERGVRQNIAGTNSLLQNIHHYFAAAEGDFVLARVHRRNAVEAHGRQPDQFHDRGHSICGVLAAARSRSRTRYVFERQQIRVAHLARGIRAYGFEHVLNGDVFAFVLAGGNRSAVKHQPG